MHNGGILTKRNETNKKKTFLDLEISPTWCMKLQSRDEINPIVVLSLENW